MNKIFYVKPTLEHEKEAIEFINEFKEYNSPIEGVNGLQRYLYNYGEWLNKIEKDRNNSFDEKNTPSETFFIVRNSDNKIVGMTTIRLKLNDRFKNFGGNISCGIRPTERRRGYGKQNLYLSLLYFYKNNVREIMVDCDKKNIASYKTFIEFGGKLIKEVYFDDLETYKQDYIIDVENAINKTYDIYSDLVIFDEDLFGKEKWL